MYWESPNQLKEVLTVKTCKGNSTHCVTHSGPLNKAGLKTTALMSIKDIIKLMLNRKHPKIYET